jgi:parallel beta-helix repeat protein
MKRFIALLFTLLLFTSSTVGLIPVHAEPKTIVVPDDYPTIRYAINNANSGDTVYVKEGTYSGTIYITKSITLQGASGKTVINDWVIDGKAAILITSNNVTVKGMTIDNPSSNTMWNEKRGIHLLGVSNCIIIDNFIAHCDYGAGIWLYQASNNLIKDNTVENGADGISLGLSTNNNVINNTLRGNSNGISLYNNADNNTFIGNYLHHNTIGIDLDESNGNEFSANEISSSNIGVQVGDYGYNRDGVIINSNVFYHNNFKNNPKNYASPSIPLYGTNYFDNGKEGNYYSDYEGKDLNADGIGDNPYTVVTESVDITDNFPLIKPWAGDNIPPLISVLSPKNETYAQGEVSLNFTVSESVSRIAYSLDNAESVTITENITLTDLPNGNHTIVIYATDVAGNEAAPKTVTFAIDVSEPEVFSALLIVLTAVIVALIVNAGWLLYFKKRKHQVIAKSPS